MFTTVIQASVTGASVRGLKGCKTLNKDPDPKNPLEGKEERSVSSYETVEGSMSSQPYILLQSLIKSFEILLC